MTFTVNTIDGIVLTVSGDQDAIEDRAAILASGLVLIRDQGIWHLDKLEWPKDDADSGPPLRWRLVLEQYQKGLRVVIAPAFIAAIIG